MAAHVKTKYDTEIAALKNKSGLTYKELSELLGCARNYVWMLCAGVRTCPLDFKEALIAIAHEADASPSALPAHDLFYWQSQYSVLVDKYKTTDYRKWSNE